MLKWTVTKRSDETRPINVGLQSRRSLGALNARTVRTPRDPNKLQSRRSLGALSHRKSSEDNKENQFAASTPFRVPLQHAQSAFSIALRDVSNLTPNSTPTQPINNLTPQNRKRSRHGTPPSIRPPQYASTLPSFDIEYSPYNLQSAPYFALRGIGIADTYYENPRYFHAEEQPPLKKTKKHEHPQQSSDINTAAMTYAGETPKGHGSTTPLSNRLDELRFSKMSFKRKSVTSTQSTYVHNNNNNHLDQSISSSLLGDTELEKMIDAILESAKKDKRTPRKTRTNQKRRISTESLTPTYTAADDPANDLKKFEDRLVDHLIISPSKFIEAGDRTIILDDENLGGFNEREVKTPDSDARNRMMRMNGADENCDDNEMGTPLETCCLRRRKAVRRKFNSNRNDNVRIGLTIPNGIPSSNSSTAEKPRKESHTMIGLTLPNGIPSPGTPAIQEPNFSCLRKSFEILAAMETPKNFAIIVDSDVSKKKNESTPEILATDLQGSSTPTGGSGGHNGNAIRRCLNFSPDLSEESLEKRQSVASSTNSRSSKINFVSGSLDLAIFFDEDDKINVHVIRCRDLYRYNGSSINAYVKVAVLSSDNNDTGFQRTAVHRNSTRPYFDHRFTFDLNESTDLQNKRIQLAVWHRDRECKRSEFLGCMSFPVNNVLKKEINGSFKLQPQSCLTNPSEPIAMGENSQSSVEEVISIEDGSATAGGGGGGGGASSMGGTKNTHQQQQQQQSLTDQQTSGQQQPNNTSTTIAFSKKAIHQRDADENLFLRFLELDPPEGVIMAVPAGLKPDGKDGGTPSATRRKSTLPQATIPPPSSTVPPMGRTPFTITKKLTRTGDKGFGFSIVWTHPPRIEKVESGLSADRCGIIPGDYVIFVDKHNVVTMPEMDILNLIRSQGNILLLEIFRRPNSRAANGIKTRAPLTSTALKEAAVALDEDALGSTSRQPSLVSSVMGLIKPTTFPGTPAMMVAAPRSSTTLCSNTSETTSKRRLHLPQVTFSKESILLPTIDDQRRKIIYQLVNREQNFVTALQFGMERFVLPMRERKNIISPNDHRTLFQNIDELLRISEDILEQLVQDDNEPQLGFISRVYLSKTTAICAAYKKYCNGLKRADCVLVNKSRNTNSDFMGFILEPLIPRKRPDLTTFIHRPLQHFREILKLIQITASHCRVDSEEYKNFSTVINDMQAAYREITVGGGLMEPLGEGRPLLTLQDLESRLVFTRCKPFVLASPGRQWIFGGDLSRVEGRSIKPYWTLLFSDILLFAKVSRDRVLFITEEPLPLANITDSCFNVRKKSTEFRITIDPNGRQAESPTVHCAPDITRTPRRNARRRSIILRAPSPELKAVWQNLLQRQIFLVNAALGSTPLSSPLESPDIIHTFVPMSDIGAATTSMASIKLSSLDSLPLKNHHHHQPPTSLKNHIVSKQLEELIDEKCRLLNKAGTSKGSALHLAQWMKGQLDKESERNPIVETEGETNADGGDDEEEEDDVDDWSPEKLRKRSRELQLVDENGLCQNVKHDISKRSESRVEEVILSEVDEESKSPSRSTTSDSQITVRSSPIAINNADKISVCLKCHKNCKNRSSSNSLNNSLKVQHSESQSPPTNRCCSSSSSQKSLVNSSSTITDSADKSESSSKTGTPTATTITGNGDSKSSGENCGNRGGPGNGNICLTNGNITEKEKLALEHRLKCRTPCKCKCNPSEYNQATLSPDEIKHEKCKIIDTGHQIHKILPSSHISNNTSHTECKCECTPAMGTHSHLHEKKKADNDDDDDDAWSMMLIGLAQINPTSALFHTDPFEAVPTISVVPPTPEGLAARFSNLFSGSKSRSGSKEDDDDDNSPEDSPQDEEPPYKVLNTSLRRYGTVSSLEKMPSEDTEDDNKTYNSSDDDDIDDDIKIVTKEVFSDQTGAPSLRNWTARAGSYVAEKMSFFEESKAFFDKYLGRKDPSLEHNDEEIVDECTSGATSGEEIWGTPTSGGENEEMHMFNSDQTHSSPTRSSSSMTGDDDTELMMDELLMAPPMTASSVRGLLPRRRLEPLFEEDTESGEETNEDDDDEEDETDEEDDDDNLEGGNLNQGFVAEKEDSEKVNGHDSRNSAGTNETISGKSTPVVTPTERIEMEMSKKTTTPVDVSEQMKIGVINYGNVADTSFTAGQQLKTVRDYVASTDTFANVTSMSSMMMTTTTMTTTSELVQKGQNSVGAVAVQPPPPVYVGGLSPRLEMRLALNHDIMGDEDLINYDPGPDLTTILGHDLSTYRQMTPRDILNRTMIVQRQAVSSNHLQTNHTSAKAKNTFSQQLQQKNSKMDTPIPNRKKPNLNTWSSSASVDLVDEGNLTDLERLARREKMFSMSQLRSGRVAPIQPTDHKTRTLGRDERSLSLQIRNNKKNKFLNFLSRRNSDNHILKFFSKEIGEEDVPTFLGENNVATRKDEIDKSLDRRFWKQLSKRRRSSSISELSGTS